MRVNVAAAVCAVGIGLGVVAAPSAKSLGSGAQAKPANQTKPGTVKLPAAVEAAFKKAYPQATIKNVSRERENGQDQYEIESINNGRGLDVNYKPDGTVIVIEEELTAAEVPSAVTAAVAARYPKATITRRERATENNRTSIELGLTGAPVKEVQLTPDGTWISPKPKAR